ncbi:membrane dipeptidase [Desulfohalotomaculum tongense]|uniref:dipeptidase n=1 Tax=Desulforadius tongensis TaxID=1216062 RepID=UPI00195D01ED|nr:dipeptidase [Desulforadius tongensis]MBM7854481.1 membrane dipeptidase [Desulforadius tongensis]
MLPQGLVVDAHCDTLTKLKEENRTLGEKSESGHVDLPRLKVGGVNVQFFAVFIHPSYGEVKGIERAMEIIDTFYKQCDQYKDQMCLAACQRDIVETVQSGRVAAVLAIEGGEALGGRLYMLPVYHRLGVRCMTLTWNGRNSIADGVGEGRTRGGLTNFGVEVVREMNKLGMLIDVSHLSEAGFWDVLDISSQPVIATHSNCAALCPHPRNLTDRQIKALAQVGGVIGLTLVPDFISEKYANLERYLDHVDHIADLVGTDHIGIGTDFDGVERTIDEVSDCTMLPRVAEGLIKRGYNKNEINNILGGNFLRILSKVVG